MVERLPCHFESYSHLKCTSQQVTESRRTPKNRHQRDTVKKWLRNQPLWFKSSHVTACLSSYTYIPLGWLFIHHFLRCKSYRITSKQQTLVTTQKQQGHVSYVGAALSLSVCSLNSLPLSCLRCASHKWTGLLCPHWFTALLWLKSTTTTEGCLKTVVIRKKKLIPFLVFVLLFFHISPPRGSWTPSVRSAAARWSLCWRW